MKSSNLAWRREPIEGPVRMDREAHHVFPIETAQNRDESPPPLRRRARLGPRSIEIRDQGFAPFRVR